MRTAATGMCLLAAEVTSPGQETRDYAKAAGYARAEAPLCLLVDQKRRKCVLHSDPAGGRYREVSALPFGEQVVLPLEQPITVDTSRF